MLLELKYSMDRRKNLFDTIDFVRFHIHFQQYKINDEDSLLSELIFDSDRVILIYNYIHRK